MFICICNAITERQVQSAVAEGAATLSDLQATLGIATCCGCCAETAVEYLPDGRYCSLPSRQQAGAQVAAAANDSCADVPLPMVTVAVRRS